jgi:hypothetical protein
MLRALNYFLSPRAAALLLVCAISGACSLDTDLTAPGAMVKFSGDRQTAPVNTALTEPMEIIVVNQNGLPLKNIMVTWAIAAGGGSLSATTALTDDSGLTSVLYTTGPTPGDAVVNAQVHGLIPLGFTVTVTP